MTYKEFRNKQQKEFDALPIFWAFSMKQFEEEMNKKGLTKNDTDKIYRVGNGGFYLKSDAQIIRDYFNKPSELKELMKNKEFVLDAFNYEMDNHEYAINHYQGDWEVVNCFWRCEYDDNKDYNDYLKDVGHKDLIPLYEQARREHFKRAEDWF